MKALVERETARLARSAIAKAAAQKRADDRKAKLNAPMWLFLWDQHTDSVRRWQGEDRFEHEDEYLFVELTPNNVVVRRRGNAYALETWATDEGHAHRKFLQFSEYRKLQG